jgi:hypothetical protein
MDEAVGIARAAETGFVTVARGSGFASSASLAFATISSLDVTVPAGVPSRPTRCAPADNVRR